MSDCLLSYQPSYFPTCSLARAFGTFSKQDRRKQIVTGSTLHILSSANKMFYYLSIYPTNKSYFIFDVHLINKAAS